MFAAEMTLPGAKLQFQVHHFSGLEWRFQLLSSRGGYDYFKVRLEGKRPSQSAAAFQP